MRKQYIQWWKTKSNPYRVEIWFDIRTDLSTSSQMEHLM